MGLEDPHRLWTYWAALVVAGVAVYGVHAASWRLAASRRVAAVTVLALVVFVEFKEGFVRHDTHVTLFFSALFCIVPALAWGRERRANALLATLLAGVAAVAALGGD